MDNELLSYLVSKINLKPHDLIPGGRYHDFKDFFRFPGLGIPRLEYPLVTPLKLPEADPDRSLFRVIKRQDLFLSFPYQTYDYVIHFVREAAIDPRVTNIRVTLYRLAQHSMIINALINSAKKGKKVFVLMELLVHFDGERKLNRT